jgi:hypothetical protein
VEQLDDGVGDTWVSGIGMPGALKRLAPEHRKIDAKVEGTPKLMFMVS